MRQQAIRSLYPSVVTFRGDTAYDGNEVIVAVDEATITTEIARLVIQADAEQVAAAETKSSAIEKLKALGLNDAEIASITGGQYGIRSKNK